MPLYVLGLMGMTRRMQHYDVPEWRPWLMVAGVGAVIAGLVLGKGNINQGFTLETFLWSLLGAVILLAVVNLVRRGSVR